VSGRRRSALRPPPAELTGFPRTRRPARLFRAHDAARGAWWFCGDLSGRFDLAAPRGTCYLASDPAGALRERLGPTLASLGFARAADVDNVVVSALRPPPGRALADAASADAARYGLTREISTTIDYLLTQAWAAALAAGRYGGVRYQPRYSTDAGAFSFAFFGRSGAAALDSDPKPSPARVVAASAGIRIEPDPPAGALRIVRPPAR